MRGLFWCMVLAFAVAAIPAGAHPLDALSAEEIEAAVTVLRDAGQVDDATRFPLIDLDEPAKAAVLAWRPEEAFPRKAFVMARRERTVYEAVVDLASRKIERWQKMPGVQSGILIEEWTKAQETTVADPGWQAAMRRRGYDFEAPGSTKDRLFCGPFSVGHIADPALRGRRLLKVGCFDIEGTRNNVWGRPIEGLYALIDVDAGKVIRLSDTGILPLSREIHAYDEAAQPSLRPALKPVVNRAPGGANFTVEGGGATGGAVRWNKWSFHYRMDRRVGLILSLLRYEDQGRERMVLYRGSIAEMFVPYMDPDPGWASRTYMDVGEYGFGLLASELKVGIDCPDDAAYFDAVIPDDAGKPTPFKSVICLFERNTGSPLWRHTEIVNDSYEGRPAVELLLRMIPAVGNYDYVIDWVLTEAGELRIDVGSTGIDEVKGVRAGTMADPSAARDTAHGMLVAANLASINHDHFLSFRLDVDIDGTANTLIRQRLVPGRMEGNRDRRSLWTIAEEPVVREGPLKSSGGHGGGEFWRIVNPGLTNKFGQHPGYELRAGHSALSLLMADDVPQRRAAFSGAPLWVTAYDPSELYAGGSYPNQSSGGDGLPAFAARHRNVTGTDIVLWYTMGFHHLTRPEDWPILSTIWHSVALVPYGFFDRNPSLDLPRDFAPLESRN
jgi:primary-amine oxidase